MPAIHKLSDAKIKACKAGTQLFDGAGLHFIKRPKGACYWKLRLTVHGRRRDMGLGPYPDISLAEAREMARVARKQARDGEDPILERSRSKVKGVTLEEAFNTIFEVHKSQLKSEASASRWPGPVTIHVLPQLGKIPVDGTPTGAGHPVNTGEYTTEMGDVTPIHTPEES